MKAIIVVLVILAAGALALNYMRGSIEEGFDPTEQGLEALAAVETCKTWTEVLDGAGDPKRWRAAHSEFDFDYRDEYTADTRAELDKKIKLNELSSGFSFLYRYSDEATFAVNFDRDGTKLNVQKMESRKDLLDP